MNRWLHVSSSLWGIFLHHDLLRNSSEKFIFTATNNWIALLVWCSVKFIFAPNFPIFRKNVADSSKRQRKTIAQRHAFHKNAMIQFLCGLNPKIQNSRLFKKFPAFPGGLVTRITYCRIYHGTIIRTGIKSLVICVNQLAGGLLLKKLKYFEVMLNMFELLRVWENMESWLVYANKPFWIAQPYFSIDIIKWS